MAQLKIVNCIVCNMPFATMVNRPRVTCSEHCAKIYRDSLKTKFKKECRYCKKEFETTISYKEYCSKECKKLYEREKFRKTLKLTKIKCGYEKCNKKFLADGKRVYCCREHARLQKALNDNRRYKNGLEAIRQEL